MKSLAMWGFAVLASVLACACSRGIASAAPESCTVSAATLAFGNFDVFTAPAAVTGSISGTCKKGSGTLPAISITLNNGLALQGNGNRAMSCTTCTGAYLSDVLQYQIYEDAGLTTQWIGSAAVTAANPCPCGNTNTAWGPVTMYGEIATPVAGGVNDSSIGSYSDTVTITINF